MGASSCASPRKSAFLACVCVAVARSAFAAAREAASHGHATRLLGRLTGHEAVCRGSKQLGGSTQRWGGLGGGADSSPESLGRMQFAVEANSLAAANGSKQLGGVTGPSTCGRADDDAEGKEFECRTCVRFVCGGCLANGNELDLPPLG